MISNWTNPQLRALRRIHHPKCEMILQISMILLHRKRLQKPKNQKDAARIFRQLARAGFGAKTIFAILKKWDVDDETLTALEGELE